MKHNILLIEVDQMHAQCMSILGCKNLKTPNLDQLAQEGSLFRHAVCQQPLCVPSRISMLTGKYPSSSQNLGNDAMIPKHIVSLPQYLQGRGFETAAFGKFHTPGLDRKQFGFDIAAPTMDEPEREIPEGNSYRTYTQKHGLPFGTDQLHGAAPQAYSSSSSPDMHDIHRKSCMSDIPEEHSLEAWTTNTCIEFLRNRTADSKPFFIWQTYDRPHNPTCLPKEWHEQIRPDELELPDPHTEEQLRKLAPYLQHCIENLHSINKFGEDTFRFIVATYYKLIEYIDHHVGRLLQEVKDLGIDEQTTIIFTSDHGDMAGWWGCYNKAQGVGADALTRVPFIIRPAPCLKGSHISDTDSPVELLDLYPTICALTDTEIPEGLEGHDLSDALLKQATPEPSRAVFSEAMSRKMITQDDWKLVMHIGDDRENLLFDMKHDPDGMDNLIKEPAHAEHRIRLKKRLLQFLVERHYGGFDEEDVEEVKDYLAPGAKWPGKLIGNLNGFYFLRCAVMMRDPQGSLFVSFYDETMSLLAAGGWDNRTLADSIPWEPKLGEALLDKAIRTLMKQCRSISPFESLENGLD